MREINQSEMSLVAGGFVPAVVAATSAVGTAATTGVGPYVGGAIVGASIYSVKKTYYEEPITGTGLAIAAGFGAVSGVGYTLGKARGSSVGQALWQANFIPISAAGQSIASNY